MKWIGVSVGNSFIERYEIWRQWIFCETDQGAWKELCRLKAECYHWNRDLAICIGNVVRRLMAIKCAFGDWKFVWHEYRVELWLGWSKYLSPKV